jgi:hypothetical protein
LPQHRSKFSWHDSVSKCWHEGIIWRQVAHCLPG